MTDASQPQPTPQPKPDPKPKALTAVIERVGRRIPDPILIFMSLYPIGLIITALLGGLEFQTAGASGEPTTHTIKRMYETENVRWIFDNALLNNWLGFGGGVLGVILVVSLAIGVAEHSGLLTAIIKRIALRLPKALLPILLVFLGILSSLAADAGYLILIPLAGLLYASIGQNPLIGMAAAFAGVSAGFSANLLPGTPIDVIVGLNAKIFAESQGVPFTDVSGKPLNPATMNYYFILASSFLLAAVGAWVTVKFVKPRLEHRPYQIPEGMNFDEFVVTPAERRGMKFAALGLLVAGLVLAGFIFGPLRTYTNASGAKVTPFLNNIILLIALFFFIVGVFFGVGSGKFKRPKDIVDAMVKQMNTIGYILVLTFFCYNFLGLLSYSGLGTYITFLGAEALLATGAQEYPILLLVGFVLTTAVINLFVGGLTSKWMLLGPIFVPMLYFVNPEMTPDRVAAAYRVADSCTNVVTPMMSYAGIILAFMRKYQPDLNLGEMIFMMVPYSIAFLISWTILLVAFFTLNIPMGF